MVISPVIGSLGYSQVFKSLTTSLTSSSVKPLCLTLSLENVLTVGFLGQRFFVTCPLMSFCSLSQCLCLCVCLNVLPVFPVLEVFVKDGEHIFPSSKFVSDFIYCFYSNENFKTLGLRPIIHSEKKDYSGRGENVRKHVLIQ